MSINSTVVPREILLSVMGLLPDKQNCGSRMRRECRERFSRHRFQRKPLVSDPSIHHGTCVTHVPWCMLGLLTRGGGENIPGIPGACATRNFTYLARGPSIWLSKTVRVLGRSISGSCWNSLFENNNINRMLSMLHPDPPKRPRVYIFSLIWGWSTYVHSIINIGISCYYTYVMMHDTVDTSPTVDRICHKSIYVSKQLCIMIIMRLL